MPEVPKPICKRYQDVIHKHGPISMGTCARPWQWEISYKRGTDGKMVIEKVCGVHKRSTEMNCKRIDKRLGYNYSKFKATKLNYDEE